MSGKNNSCTYSIMLTKDGKLEKDIILKAIKDKFNFPDYFGNNWDGVYDLMLDYVDGITQAETACFLLSDGANIDEEALNNLVSVLEDVVEYADGQGINFKYMIKSQ